MTANYARFSPQGRVSIREAIELVTNAIVFCREQKCPKLLANVSELTGFDPPTIFDRRLAVGQWARASQGAVILATVLRPEWIDAGKYGVILATSMGLRTDRFPTEPEASAWLADQKLL